MEAFKHHSTADDKAAAVSVFHSLALHWFAVYIQARAQPGFSVKKTFDELVKTLKQWFIVSRSSAPAKKRKVVPGTIFHISGEIDFLLQCTGLGTYQAIREAVVDDTVNFLLCSLLQDLYDVVTTRINGARGCALCQCSMLQK